MTWRGFCRWRAWLLLAGVWLSGGPLWAGLWVTGYFPGWEQDQMPASAIDFTTITHVIHFSLIPQSDGTLNLSDNGLSAAKCSNAVAVAHAAGAKAIVCVGGAGTSFQSAVAPANLAGFVGRLAGFVNLYGYDGLDVDWEPLSVGDANLFTNFIKALRGPGGLAPGKLLTIAATPYPVYGESAADFYAIFASLQGQFDQINVMTYDMSGPYEDWVTWFNSPLYGGGFTFPGTEELLPSADEAIGGFISAGVATRKLGVGQPFYGYLWTGGAGVDQPQQGWPAADPPTTTALDYNTIMSSYYQASRYRWFPVADAAYLSVTNTPATNDQFISFDDARACQCKVSYARNRGLGGVMIWELAQDHTAGRPDPLLQTIKEALATPSLTAIQPTSTNIWLTFAALPLASYSILWTSNLLEGNWRVITTTAAGTGGLMRIADPAPANQPRRFYRVQTPP
jgi:chitinase